LGHCAEALARAGAGNEAADARVAAATLLRVGGWREAAAAELEAARALERDDGELELTVRVAVALEALAQVEDAAALRAASTALAALPGPVELERIGQRQLAWIYDRTLLATLHRCGRLGEADTASVARRQLRTLETFMAKAPPLDRRTLRQSLLLEAGEAGPLRELVREIEAAEHEEPREPQAGEPEGLVRRSPPEAALAGQDEQGVRRRDQADLQHRLLRIFRRLAREDRLERLLEQVVEAMMELTDAERGVVCVGQGEERIEVTREFARGIVTGERDGVAFSRSVIDRVMRDATPVLSIDAAEDERFDGSRSISHLNLRSVLAVPLVF
ncbi:MAG: GAF domain-containing protein, partial [Myxococcales bacterium]|nr:GAF domain-containing protein [Myxococcales bacterium]